LAIQKARDNNMPLENIERAIKRGSGELEGVSLVEMTFEGYGPGGAAILVQALSDNRNRTLQDVRNIFSRGGGSLGESGCVAWLFESKGLISVKTDGLDAEELALQAIDAGAEDVKVADDYVEIYTRPEELVTVREALEERELTLASTEVAMVPKTMVELEEKAAVQMLRLLEKLEELDEVQNVTTNADFPDAVLEKQGQQS
jgi:YebC/PmpR family DNA-binding regulatory protein